MACAFHWTVTTRFSSGMLMMVVSASLRRSRTIGGRGLVSSC